MILPTKHIAEKKALLTIAASLLRLINRPKTISSLWEESRKFEQLSYDWFVLALDFLFTIAAIDMENGLIYRTVSHDSKNI